MHAWCRIDLLGAVRVTVGTAEAGQFRSRKVAELLAFLALHRDRICTREELSNILWPDEYDDSARMNRLSNALCALRTQMEPPSVAKGSVIEADRYSIKLRSETVVVDALEFSAAIKASSMATELREKIEHGERAFKLFRGDLTPTLDPDWIFAERMRLQDAYALLLTDLRNLWEESGELAPAIDYGSRLVELDPYSEPSHASLIRLYLLAGKNAAAQEQFAKMEEVLDELSAKPSPETVALFGTAEMRSTASRRPVRAEQAVAVLDQPSNQSEERTSGPSLPFQTTRFFGREEEIALALQVLGREGTRMVTLIGPGGSGKTRLSIEIARAASEKIQGCVYFAALADVTDPSFIGDAVLAGLGESRQPSIPITTQIAEALEPNAASLIVFDNVEQLIEDIGAAAEELLALVPGLKIIATSRRILNLTGETELPVPPLPLPLPDNDLSPAEMIEYPSIALFVDRVQHVCAGFRLADRNAPAVAELCRRLDGMPLAIELAATWAKTLTPQQMLLQLGRRFDFLVTRRRDVPARHQKMLAIIESSYLQLDPALQEFFVKLSVFEGGWTLEAAQAICADMESHGANAMSYLQELLERTLLTSAELDTNDGCTMRFGMLETIKAFCENQLDAEEKHALILAHLNYFADYAKTYGQPLFNYQMKMPLQAFAADLPNYRLALRTAAALSLWQQPSMILLHTHEGWLDLGLIAELRDWVELVPTQDMDERTLTLMTRSKAKCASESGRFERAVPLYENCLEGFRLLGEEEGVAATMANLALADEVLGNVDSARLRIDQALELARKSGNRPLLSRMTAIQGEILMSLGDSVGAHESYSESLLLSNGQGPTAAGACGKLAALEILDGCYPEAEVLCERALEILADSPNASQEVFVYLTLGRCCSGKHNLDQMLQHFFTAAELTKRCHDPRAVADFLAAVASVAQEMNDDWTALVLVHAAGLDQRGDPHLIPNSNLTLANLVANLDSGQTAKAASLGQAMTVAEAIRFAEDFLKNLKENLAAQEN